MKSIISPFNWREELEKKQVDAIGEDIILLDNPIITPIFDFPFKVDVTTAIIALRGVMRGFTDLKPYTTQAPCLFVVLPGQILQYEYITEDFLGLFIIMSKRFTESLNIQERIPLFLSIHENPCIPLSAEESVAMVSYYKMLKRAVKVKDNPNRLEVAKHLTMAFFYGLGYKRHKQVEENRSRNDILTENFLNLVQENYKQQRGVGFYADLLCLTPKYLSKIIKQTSGMSAANWIDNHVVLEAKALLKSTNMTVQQISDELNFPSQSFFGKYFKLQTGLSPRVYREK